MIQGLNTRAFTIVEVLIVLAVTTVLLASVMLTISGQQSKTQFSQAMNDIQAQIDDVINNVATGYYANVQDVGCSAGALGPNINSSGAGLGSNQECIFIGRAMQLSVSTDPSDYNVYNLAGLKRTAGRETQSLAEAIPTAVAAGETTHTDVPDAFEGKKLNYGLSPISMKYVDGSNPITVSCPAAPSCIGAVAFISSLASYSSSGDLISGSQHVDLVPIPGTKLGQTKGTAVDNIDNNAKTAPQNPSGGVVICFKSGGNNEYGVITIGSNGRTLSSKLDVFYSLPTSGACT